MMSFEHPFILLLLILVPLYLWSRVAWYKKEMKALRTFVRPVLWDRVKINPPPERKISRIIWAFSIAMMILAAGSPLWGTTEALVDTGGKNLVIALDVSRSMASMDEAPSRLARASGEICRLASELPDVRMALILFSGSSRLAVPLTLDRDFLLERLPWTPDEVSDLPPGTRLADMVELMADVLPDMDLEANLGLIFSDGGFHDYAVESAVDAASGRGMKLITVGVGGPIEVPVPLEGGGVLLNADGDTVKTKLEKESLKTLAAGTGGVYLDLSGTEDLADVVRRILENISAHNRKLTSGGSTAARRFQYPLAAALLLAAAAMILERRGK